LNRPSAHTSPVSSDEERVARPHILHDASVSTQGVRRGPPERNVSFLLALPHDPEHAFFEIDVLGIQADEFRDSDQGIEKDEQDRPIPDAHPGPAIWCREHRLELFVGEGRHDGPGHPRQLKARRDVFWDVAHPVALPAQGLQDLRVTVDRVGREALATAI
jgi:hypothetical protein